MSIEQNRLQELRCADQDRELVAQLLNNAYADGRLTFDEHADRIAKAYDAKTFGDLTPLTTDLVAPQPQPVVEPYSAPTPAGSPDRRPVPAQFAGPPAVPGIDAFTGGNAVMSTFKPGQLHTIASNVTINSWLGDARIDLVGAAFESRDTTINVGGLMGEISIRVPEGVSVDLSRLNMIMGESKVDGAVPHPDGIRLRLVGTFIMGEVTVLGPDTTRVRKYQRFTR
ncbi:DUF1707 and DUF2154 domain-containing protein [Tessaracoccus sp. MC1865]|uniref:DUF1707 SHOCT-like domain-containing protein n=1 Tax=Tessaracoccus sp. MC1865 TaxID=2760310 RepID=UPI00160286CB|nr:DUF1707 domain-containing protein [Tessaracoccus sp. MC1865]MBB1484143.1 DUF1707 and DUF2154 domain-containing protein [Tessaracoccus sp. MC1865]QTO37170.1 DUF1707 and DUF2154 domain-containing protein [Tessaracoccus sp. MC1865]